MGRENVIVKRIYYVIQLSLQSPLALSGGNSESTDMDVLRNGKGELFIPGTSLAGAFRSYLEEKKNTKGLFGYAAGEEGAMSSIHILDLYFDTRPIVSVRDGVQLNINKTVENKFDMEIIEPGVNGKLYVEYVLREKDLKDNLKNDSGNKKEKNPENEFAAIIEGINDGAIRLGGNKNRGFGRLRAEKIWQNIFEAENVDEWIDFCKNGHDASACSEGEDCVSWLTGYLNKHNDTLNTPEYIRYSIPLRLTGGISIRRYSVQPDKADFEHITCHMNPANPEHSAKPIIPGTSWNGAIRADIKDILGRLGCSDKKIRKLINYWFGYVNVNDELKEENPSARQSMVIFGESILEGGTDVPITRNKINRFDSSTIESALYSEITHCGGETTLDIMIRAGRKNKTENRKYALALLAMLQLVAQDIVKGYLAVGGQTSIGRGIFTMAGKPTISVADDKDIWKEAQQHLLEILREEM